MHLDFQIIRKFFFTLFSFLLTMCFKSSEIYSFLYHCKLQWFFSNHFKFSVICPLLNLEDLLFISYLLALIFNLNTFYLLLLFNVCLKVACLLTAQDSQQEKYFIFSCIIFCILPSLDTVRLYSGNKLICIDGLIASYVSSFGRSPICHTNIIFFSLCHYISEVGMCITIILLWFIYSSNSVYLCCIVETVPLIKKLLGFVQAQFKCKFHRVNFPQVRSASSVLVLLLKSFL